MVIKNNPYLAILRGRISSLVDTTIAALHTLENGRMHGLLMDAAVKRTKELTGIKLL